MALALALALVLALALALALARTHVLTRKERPRRMPRIAGGPQALSAITPA